MDQSTSCSHNDNEWLGGTLEDSAELVGHLKGTFCGLQSDSSFVTLLDFEVGTEQPPRVLRSVVGVVRRRLSYCEIALRWKDSADGVKDDCRVVLRLPDLSYEGVAAVLQWAHEGQITIPHVEDVVLWCLEGVRAAKYLGAPRVEELCAERAVREAVRLGPSVVLAVLNSAVAAESMTLTQHVIAELAKPGAFTQAAACDAWRELSVDSMLHLLCGADGNKGSVGLGEPESTVFDCVVRWAEAQSEKRVPNTGMIREVLCRICYHALPKEHLEGRVRNMLRADSSLSAALGFEERQDGAAARHEWAEAIIARAAVLQLSSPANLLEESRKNLWMRRTVIDWRDTPLDVVLRFAGEGESTSSLEVGLRFFEGGRGCKQDLDEAQKFLASAAESGSCQAAVALAELRLCAMRSSGGRDAAAKLAHAALKRGLESLAAAGEPEAQMRLGWLYFEGIGIEKNHEAAACWCRRAAEQGHLGGMFSLACMLFEGYGVLEDKQEAVRLWTCASEAGHPWSTSRLNRARG